jgi:hypothetical protein
MQTEQKQSRYNTPYKPDCILCGQPMESPIDTNDIKNLPLENFFNKYIHPECEKNHTCPIKLKHAHGYQCPECYKITD